MLTITLTPEMESVFTQQALIRGSTPEQIALDALQESVLVIRKRSIEHVEWVERVKRIALPTGVSLSEDDLSRESMYD